MYKYFEYFSDILRTDRTCEPEQARKQKACDADSLSKYNKLAKTGGHKSEVLFYRAVRFILVENQFSIRV